MFLKILALSVVGTLLALLLKKNNKELIIFLDIAIVCTAFFMLRGEIADSFEKMHVFTELFGESEKIISCTAKGAVIAIASKITSEICRESGNAVFADVIEFGGRIMLIILVLPFVTQMAEMAVAFIK